MSNDQLLMINGHDCYFICQRINKPFQSFRNLLMPFYTYKYNVLIKNESSFVVKTIKIHEGEIYRYACFVPVSRTKLI